MFKKYILGIQHVLAMFGSTVLVPYITGLDTSIALLCAGIGTLIFHLCSKGIVPVFLGSSFAFIPAIILSLKNYDIAYLKGGVIVAGLLYVIISILLKYISYKVVRRYFPPIVIGPIIIAIGLKLSPIALAMSGYSADKIEYDHMMIALITLISMVGVSFLQKSFFRFMPILVAISIGYLCSFYIGLIDVSAVINSPWITISTHTEDIFFTMPEFNFTVIFIVAPLAFVTFSEHIGDIQTNGSVVGKDFIKNPGLHRTLLGDGLATCVAGFLGGPPNTTYAENTGVLAATKVYDPKIIRIAAVMTIVLAFCGKLIALLQSMPTPVMGGISMILFGLIATIGIKVLIEAQVDFNNYKNLVVPAIILISGIFIDSLKISDTFQISGLFIATILGIVFNRLLPER